MEAQLYSACAINLRGREFIPEISGLIIISLQSHIRGVGQCESPNIVSFLRVRMSLGRKKPAALLIKYTTVPKNINATSTFQGKTLRRKVRSDSLILKRRSSVYIFQIVAQYIL